jgi:tetratricopeptide (TPR) repeat protein
VKIEKTLHAGNIAAAFGVVATTADVTLTGGAATAIGAALSGVSLYKDASRSEKTEMKLLAKHMQTALDTSHLTRDRKIIAAQLLAKFPTDESDFLSGNMIAVQVCESMRAQVKAGAADPEHRTTIAQEDYALILEKTLEPILAPVDRTEAMMMELLARTDTSKYKAELAEKDEFLIGLARRIANNVEDVDAAVRELNRTIEIVLNMDQRAELPSNASDQVDAVLKRVNALNEAGGLDGGAETIEEALAQADAQKARLLEVALDQDILRRDAQAAAGRLWDRLRMDVVEGAQFDELQKLWGEWFERGQNKGLRFDVEVSEHIARIGQKIAKDGISVGIALNDLGISLLELSDSEQQTTRLEEAKSAFLNALDHRRRDTDPLNWAMTTANLSNARARLALRAGDANFLREAMEGYRVALPVWESLEMDIDWASANGNFGVQLLELGGLENDYSILIESEMTIRRSLEILTKENATASWAMAKMNLANALSGLDERSASAKRQTEALECYQEVLEVYTRDKYPMRWGMAQHNRANSLRMIGIDEGNVPTMRKSVDVYRLALEERTRDRVPMEWARTHNNLGDTLMALAEMEGNPSLYGEAEQAFRLALEVRTFEALPMNWAVTMHNLGVVLTMVGQHTSDTKQLIEAIEIFKSALKVRTVNALPWDYALTMSGLAGAEVLLFKRTGDRSMLDAARSHALAARSVYLDSPALDKLQMADGLLAQIEALRGGTSA